VNQDYDFKFRDRTLLDQRLDAAGEFFAFTDGSARFFGFQSRSAASNETNYADEEVGFALSAAYSLLPRVRLVVGDRFRRVDIGRSAVTSLPSNKQRFTAAAVARNLLYVTTKNFVVNPGVGFRAVVRPNVVGRVDIGFGKEGAAIFATLGYPF